MNKRGQLDPNIIKLVIGAIIVIFVIVPLINSLSSAFTSPENLAEFLPSLIILAVIFEIIRRFFR